MASTNTLQVIQNNQRNAIILATQVSDGTDGETVTIYNATSSGAFGVNVGGQIFYPGIYTKILGLDYDVQDMKIAIQWEATPDHNVLALGSAPEDFRWDRIGGLPLPAGLTAPTGSIKVKSLGPSIGATYFVLLYLRKGVPQS